MLNCKVQMGARQSQHSGAEVILQAVHALADYINKNVKNL
ncbi:hypothetical protein DSOL_4282 [Desulfosporosinus metallidurans]|uniref:Uncharacterized protein n=1 Tax=Desulfosporosinus metallidurans TaxID=1888891 RepID=A0A1Q8QL19_9FIRM|nr:hypothetical protein DSOL_4282 [Desulfosporosinus metallidurans]